MEFFPAGSEHIDGELLHPEDGFDETLDIDVPVLTDEPAGSEVLVYSDKFEDEGSDIAVEEELGAGGFRHKTGW